MSISFTNETAKQTHIVINRDDGTITTTQEVTYEPTKGPIATIDSFKDGAAFPIVSWSVTDVRPIEGADGERHPTR